MKDGNVLIVIFLIGLIVFGSLIFLIKTPRLNNLRQNSTPQVFPNKNNIQNKQISTSEPISQGITLEINEPKENTVFNNSLIKVSGKTWPYAEVYVNDKQTQANETGTFSLDYNLDEGENLLTVVANDSAGNYAEKEMTVYLQTQE